ICDSVLRRLLSYGRTPQPCGRSELFEDKRSIWLLDFAQRRRWSEKRIGTNGGSTRLVFSQGQIGLWELASRFSWSFAAAVISAESKSSSSLTRSRNPCSKKTSPSATPV